MGVVGHKLAPLDQLYAPDKTYLSNIQLNFLYIQFISFIPLHLDIPLHNLPTLLNITIMPGQRPILCMGFVASLGLTFNVLACYSNKPLPLRWFTPLVIFLFYILSPIPIIIYSRASKTNLAAYERQRDIKDFIMFLTAGIFVSAIALPITLTTLVQPLVSMIHKIQQTSLIPLTYIPNKPSTT